MTVEAHQEQQTVPAESGSETNASVVGLDKTFATKRRTVHALRDIDLQVERGEYVVVLGPSGCGKTTLIRCIAGLEHPTRGRVTLPGRTVFDHEQGVDVDPNRRNVGLVFQNYALWPHMTIERNVAYPLRMRKVRKPERARRVAEVLESLECGPLAARLPAELSGGQQQRVALARALVSEPGILLLDEPLSNLDALLRVSLRAELLRLHRKLGFTAIHITHDQDEALEMGDRVLLMREGRIEQLGPPKDVYARPVSPYAATFLGVRNRIEVTAESGRLGYAGLTVDGSAGAAALARQGETLQLFARTHDIHVTSTDDRSAPASGFGFHGTVAQTILGEGGRQQHIVDVAGQQWYAGHSSSPELRPGDRVRITVPVDRALLYRNDELVSVPA